MLHWLRTTFFSEGKSVRKLPIVGITQETLEVAAESAKHEYPNEFLCMLSAESTETLDYEFDEEGAIITEIALIPGTFSDTTSATLQSHNVPTSPSYVGSLHSHPSGSTQPSQQDLSMFGGGRIHIIMGKPYTMESWQAYDRRGNAIELPVYEDVTTGEHP